MWALFYLIIFNTFSLRPFYTNVTKRQLKLIKIVDMIASSNKVDEACHSEMRKG